MNFFEHQDQARRQTRKLVVLFTLAVLSVIAAVNLVILAVFAYPDTALPDQPPFWTTAFFLEHTDVILWVSGVTGALIGILSVFRTMQLGGGGAVVAQQLGGVRVEPDPQDPLRRRLRNVVEEIAIASGVPVPDIFVLEGETAINAFAAGHSTSDAAIAVTRGTLEQLNREELQGVVAHEFAHIHNGDMRLNIRLIGLLFGILSLALIGRMMLYSGRFSRNRNAGGVVVLGLAIMLIGYIGVFFGRWIKAAVSRQREYLADASAVQFTRQPRGIGGALKKIAIAHGGPKLRADAEEVGHMLFANPLSGALLATHPPILDRIKAVDPSFQPEDLDRVRDAMRRHAQARQAEAETAREREQPRKGRGLTGAMLDPDRLIDRIGQPGMGEILAAGLLAESMPRSLERAAHSNEWAMELVCTLLLSEDTAIRDRQLEIIRAFLGAESLRQVRILWESRPELTEEQRLPLFEMAYPAIRHRPAPDLEQLLKLIDRLIHADLQVDAFEYALGRLLRLHLDEARHPEQVQTSGNRKIGQCLPQINDLLRILAHHGHTDQDAAVAALTAGMEVLGTTPTETHPLRENWPHRLDTALKVLDRLKAREKVQLVRALVTTVRHAGETVTSELELMRAICACLHVPLPLLREQQPD